MINLFAIVLSLVCIVGFLIRLAYRTFQTIELIKIKSKAEAEYKVNQFMIEIGSQHFNHNKHLISTMSSNDIQLSELAALRFKEKPTSGVS